MAGNKSTALQTKSGKERKRRVVKNSYVDTDAVTVKPGIDYCDWKKIAKRHLKERENALFDIKRSEIEHIVNTELESYRDKLQLNEFKPKAIPIVIPPTIYSNTLHELYCKIDEWSGVDLSRRKSPIARYRDYFAIGKNWLSQIKTKIFGNLFWVHLLRHIRKTLNNPVLEVHVIAALFRGTVSYSNTKPISLINGGTLIHSEQLHRYLMELHPSLQVKQWIRQQELRGNYKKKAQAVGTQIQTDLSRLIRCVDFQSGQTRHALPIDPSIHDPNPQPQPIANRNTISVPLPLPLPLPIFTNTNTNNGVDGIPLVIPPQHLLPPMVPNHNTMNNENNIHGLIRGPSMRVSGNRYSPMLSIPEFETPVQRPSRPNINPFAPQNITPLENKSNTTPPNINKRRPL